MLQPMSVPSADTTATALFDLSGRTALLSGASGLLGTQFAHALAEAGASVVASSRELAKAEARVAELPAGDGQSHHAVTMDQLDTGSIATAFDDALDRVGRVDILINNGTYSPGKDWTNVSEEEFTADLRNATGYFSLARRFREHVVSRDGGGTIVMLGSMYGVVGSYPDSYEGVTTASPVSYHTLKGGIVHMTRHLAVYWAGDGIRINTLSPGPFPAPSASGAMVERLKARSPMKRMGQPHELKGALLFLASDASSYLTGHNLVVDGGWTAW